MRQLNELTPLLARAKTARENAQWAKAVSLYQELDRTQLTSYEVKHGLGLTYFSWGKFREAIQSCSEALALNPELWQSVILIAKAHRELGALDSAFQFFKSIMNHPLGSSQARIGLADISMNQFGRPLDAIELVRPLRHDSSYAADAILTTLMASLYDRADWNVPGNAAALSQRVKDFSRQYLCLPELQLTKFSNRETQYLKNGYRPRVGLISPLFCTSPVYFLTIAGWRQIAPNCEIVIFNRGYQQDWATDNFRELSSQWLDVQQLSATQLAEQIRAQDLDVLYDLGGWMDAVALKALSAKPARQMFKWVGGQSITTGLTCFDGWIGDASHSPSSLQNLYSEPLIQIPNNYTTYTPPSYLPKIAKRKINTPCIFANPAKVSTPFLKSLENIPGRKVFIHRQYLYPQAQERIIKALGKSATFITPGSHEEALQALNSHAVMIDTFPYSSGLTAREALAMGTQVQVLQIGELFCERHMAFSIRH